MSKCPCRVIFMEDHILIGPDTGCPRKSEKSNHLVWHKNKVEFLFLAHQLRSNICPFCLIKLTKPWCLLFWSKIRMQKILRSAKSPIFGLVSVIKQNGHMLPHSGCARNKNSTLCLYQTRWLLFSLFLGHPVWPN